MPTPFNSSQFSFITSFSGLTFIDALLGGIKWGSSTPGTGINITYSFPQINATFDTNYGFGELASWSPATSQQQAYFTSALQSWANVANITFTQVTESSTSVGDIRFALTSVADPGEVAHAYYPGSYPEAGDVWFISTSPAAAYLAPGGSGFETLVHEVGHALGLKHPFDPSGSGVLMPIDYDVQDYTVMTYNDSIWGETLYINSTNWAAAPMLFDVLAIQYLYGVNTTYQLGNTNWTFTTNSVQAVWDAGGTDTFNFSNYTDGALIDINQGGFSTNLGASGFTASIAVAYGAVIENATGSNAADIILGNSSNNLLIGLDGNDIFYGGAGSDTISGGLGFDLMSYGDATAGVVVSLLTGASNDGFGFQDFLSSIEDLGGSDYADRLTGDSSGNFIFGGLGNDTLEGGLGIDTLEGGAGNDTYILNDLTDLNDIIIEAANAGSDTLSVNFSHYLQGANIENLTLTGAAYYGVGTAEANILTGNAGENLLIAGEGADTIYGGGARDAIFGEAGADLIYGEDGIDYLIGGTGDDTIYGGNQADEIYGQDGNDLIYGGDDFQTDILVGGAGNDTIDGGDAWDLVYGGEGDDVFYVSQQVDWVFEFAGQGNDTVYSRSQNGYYLYDEIENLVLLDNSPFGVGNGLDNRITGNATANTLLGGLGNDTLDGGAGLDILWGEGGADTFKISQGTGLDIIADWTLGSDKLDVSAFGFANLAAAKANMLQVGNDISMNLGNGDALILLGVNINNISAGDMILV
jgi:Ca2+-binding RTX toxin-like protein